MRTQVAIIGAGPAGLLLGQLLHQNGIDNVVLERQTREHVLGRIRAGVIEQARSICSTRSESASACMREGLVHDGIADRLEGGGAVIDFKKLTGKTVMVYGQTEITKDLIDGRDGAGGRRSTTPMTSPARH